MNLQETFTTHLSKHNLVKEKLLLMISGGVDSRSLFEIAKNTLPKEQIAVFHLNHNLRKNSVQDFEFVENLCKENDIKFYGYTLKKTEKSNENLWRKERQKLAKESAKDFGATKTLTAHHATDLAETMIFRLTKGCGIDGLAPFDISTKPFWKIPKSELENFAKENKLEFCTDETNEDTTYERNLIRHNVLPELRKITPNLEKVFVKEFQIFSETQNFLDSQLHSTNTPIPLKTFSELPQTLKRELLRKIAKQTPSFAEIEDCLKWLERNPKGKSKKEVGGTKLEILNGKLNW